ncbi:hypothetical protein K435DRAFT_908783 [Dendrothele bispora CBS 962.96]|uniref:Uncharacterized protein n=1 Tax=Dendrothele bispora (strain CBS 962.96) TaxID=1314807 RepID=A0A4S8LQH9_DENBC|nr:hypothetical protein K435DRAFT_908783 [Dendrothele bispora CBS 962.96]
MTKNYTAFVVTLVLSDSKRLEWDRSHVEWSRISEPFAGASREEEGHRGHRMELVFLSNERPAMFIVRGDSVQSSSVQSWVSGNEVRAARLEHHHGLIDRDVYSDSVGDGLGGRRAQEGDGGEKKGGGAAKKGRYFKGETSVVKEGWKEL